MLDPLFASLPQRLAHFITATHLVPCIAKVCAHQSCLKYCLSPHMLDTAAIKRCRAQPVAVPPCADPSNAVPFCCCANDQHAGDTWHAGLTTRSSFARLWPCSLWPPGAAHVHQAPTCVLRRCAGLRKCSDARLRPAAACVLWPCARARSLAQLGAHARCLNQQLR